MTSQENKQVVMRGYQLFGNKDIDGLLALFADDIEFILEDSDILPYGHTYHGKQETAQFFTDLDRAQEAILFEPRDFIAEGDKVVAIGDSEWTVRSTGRHFRSPWAHVFMLRDGKITQFHAYEDTAATEKAFMPQQQAGQAAQPTMRH